LDPDLSDGLHTVSLRSSNHRTRLTQHVSIFILTTTLCADVRRDTKIYDNVHLARVSTGVKTSNEEEANTGCQNLGQFRQATTECWEGEGILGNIVERKAKSCYNKVNYISYDGEPAHTLKLAAGLLKLGDLVLGKNEGAALW